VFEYRRTPYLGLVYAAVIGFAVVWFVESPDRPMSVGQMTVFYLLSYLPGLGLAMLGDPAARRAKADYLKVDYYAPREDT
jgi:hypothetical protein